MPILCPSREYDHFAHTTMSCSLISILFSFSFFNQLALGFGFKDKCLFILDKDRKIILIYKCVSFNFFANGYASNYFCLFLPFLFFLPFIFCVKLSIDHDNCTYFYGANW